MPPIRTNAATMTPVKPVKTERTHEENQERAYIAASRRSDRSLEARIESARRASEIHKKRTGRALRVTEQDVINEEMYEEEDDDLPAQYRRLTAHLNTNSYEFNRRLQSMIATQVGTRQALMEQGSQYFFNQTYPNMPYFAPQTANGPMQASMMPPQMINRSPDSYRQQPYPSPHTPQQTFHQRSMSIPTPNEVPGFTHKQPTSPVDAKFEEQRRMSLPGNPSGAAPQPQITTRPSLSRNVSTTRSTSAELPSPHATISPLFPQQSQQQQTTSAYPFMAPIPMYDPMAQGMNFSPFSTALPLESQQLLGGSFDMSYPMNQYLMAGSEHTARPTQSQPFYSYKPNASSMTRPQQVSSGGMNATLAPTHFDFDSPENTFASSNAPSMDGVSTPFTPTYQINPNDFADVKGQFLSGNNSTHGSGTVTPNGQESDFFNWDGLDESNPITAPI